MKKLDALFLLVLLALVVLFAYFAESEQNLVLLIGFAAVILFSYFLSKFHFALFAIFLALSAVLLQIGMPGFAWVTLLLAAIVTLHWFLVKLKEKGSKAGKKLREGLDKEWDKMEAAKGSYPKVKVWDESLHALGKKTGEGLLAGEKGMPKFSSPQPVSRIAKGLQNLIDGFFKIFKK